MDPLGILIVLNLIDGSTRTFLSEGGAYADELEPADVKSWLWDTLGDCLHGLYKDVDGVEDEPIDFGGISTRQRRARVSVNYTPGKFVCTGAVYYPCSEQLGFVPELSTNVIEACKFNVTFYRIDHAMREERRKLTEFDTMEE